MKRILGAAVVALLVAAGLACLVTRQAAAQADTVTVTNPGNQTTVLTTDFGTQVSLQIDATSSEALPLSYSADGLPPGLDIDYSTGLISGYVYSGGQYQVQVTATDSSGGTGSVAFTWVVDAVTVTTPADQTTAWGTQASLQIHASDSAGLPLTYSATGIPPGLSINGSTGLISGTTTQLGYWDPEVTVSDTSGASASSFYFEWDVVNQVTITDPGLQVTKPGTKVSLQIHASDSPGLPLAYQATGLPTGLSINGSTGLISGMTTQAEYWYPEVTVTDPYESNTVDFEWLVDKISVPSPGPQSTKLGTAVVLPIQASNNSYGSVPLSYTASNLPPGLIGSTTGLIYGTPTTPGSYKVTVTVSDGTTSGSATFTWTVWTVDKVSVASPGNQATALGAAVSLQVHATSSAGLPLSYSAGGLPAGLSISRSTGLISGKTKAAGRHPATVTVSDGITSGSVTFLWTVTATTTYNGTIRQVKLGYCLDDRGNSRSNGAVAQVWTCNGRASQVWQVMNDGTIRHNGLCLDAAGSGTANGTKVQLWACTGKPSQQWNPRNSRVNYANPAAVNMVLTDPGNGGNGTQQVLLTDNGTKNQIWTTS